MIVPRIATSIAPANPAPSSARAGPVERRRRLTGGRLPPPALRAPRRLAVGIAPAPWRALALLAPQLLALCPQLLAQAVLGLAALGLARDGRSVGAPLLLALGGAARLGALASGLLRRRGLGLARGLGLSRSLAGAFRRGGLAHGRGAGRLRALRGSGLAPLPVASTASRLPALARPRRVERGRLAADRGAVGRVGAGWLTPAAIAARTPPPKRRLGASIAERARRLAPRRGRVAVRAPW